MACSEFSCPMSGVCTAGGTSSMTWMPVSASWTRMPQVSEWIAAFVAL
jgi:hypothetical protein